MQRLSIGTQSFSGFLNMGKPINERVYNRNAGDNDNDNDDSFYDDDNSRKDRAKRFKSKSKGFKPNQLEKRNNLVAEVQHMKEQINKNIAEGKDASSLQAGVEESQKIIELYDKLAEATNGMDIKFAKDEIKELRKTLVKRNGNGMLSPRLRNHVPELEEMADTTQTTVTGSTVAPVLEAQIIKETPKPINLPAWATAGTLLFQLLK